jgi:hypothetical protein
MSSRLRSEEGSLAALERCGSISITGRIHRCSWLGPRWPDVAQPRAWVAKPAASPVVGRPSDAWSGRACARGGARQGECGGVCGYGRGGLERRNVSGSLELCFLSMADAWLSGKVQRDMTVWPSMDRRAEAWG